VQVQCVRVPLAAEADYSHRLAAQQVEIASSS